MEGKHYTDIEIEFIKENYLHMSTKEMARILDRSTDGISAKLKELGLKRKENSMPYTDKEINFIKENIDKMTIADIARELNRTQSGISKYIMKHRIHHIRKRKKIYLENIEKDITPIYSKGQVYYEIIEKMKVNDSFAYPHAEKAIVENQKYMYINLCKESGKKVPAFITRKTHVEDGIEMRRIWRIL